MSAGNNGVARSALRALIVDDELGMREFLELSLRHRGYEVLCAQDGQQAIARLGQDDRFDIVISDLTMPHAGGLEVLRASQAQAQPPITIMMTAYATTDSAVEAMKLGAEDYLVKPFKLDELHMVIDRALARRDVLHENQRLKAALDKVERLDQMVARSPKMTRVFELIRKAAPTPVNVLITGESGTGKELIARALHQLSSRKDQPWVPVNCAAIPAQLLESELFGHVKGAFTGANKDRVGLFESAGKGTVFLDEIGEMELAMQAKLLRVLQERKVRPVGGCEERELHCRVVTATHRDLQTRVDEGAFREDLYFRLNVIRIEVPPLRDRREDVPLLVERFFQICNQKMGARLSGISSEAMNWFLHHDYPGNVRELENLMERAVALEGGNQLGVEQLPRYNAQDKPTQSTQALGALEEVLEALARDEPLDLDEVLASFEAKILKSVMLRCEGQRKLAAAQLSISERSLRYRLQKLGERKQAA